MKGLKHPVFSVHNCYRKNVAIIPPLVCEKQQWAPLRSFASPRTDIVSLFYERELIVLMMENKIM